MKKLLLLFPLIFLWATAYGGITKSDLNAKLQSIRLDTLGTAKPVSIKAINGDSLFIYFYGDSTNCGYVVYSRATERLYFKRCDGGDLVALDSVPSLGSAVIADTSKIVVDAYGPSTDKVVKWSGASWYLEDLTSGVQPLSIMALNDSLLYWTIDGSAISNFDGNGMTVTSNSLNVVGDTSLTSNADYITVAKIPDFSVSGTNKIVAGAVNSDDILDNTIGTADIGAGGVASSEILDVSIAPADIDTSAVTRNKLDTIGSYLMKDLTLTDWLNANDSVLTPKIIGTSRIVQINGWKTDPDVRIYFDTVGTTGQWHLNDKAGTNQLGAGTGGGDSARSLALSQINAARFKLSWPSVGVLQVSDTAKDSTITLSAASGDTLVVAAYKLGTGTTLFTLNPQGIIPAFDDSLTFGADTAQFKAIYARQVGDTGTYGNTDIYGQLRYRVDTGGGQMLMVFDDSVTNAPTDDQVWAWDAGTGRWTIQSQTGGSGEATSASNVGSGEIGWYKQEVGDQLQFYTLANSATITWALEGDSVKGTVVGGAGETDTLSNNGAWNGSTGYTLIFDSLGTKKILKGLKEGSGITITAEGDTALTFASTGGSGDSSRAVGLVLNTSTSDTVYWKSDGGNTNDTLHLGSDEAAVVIASNDSLYVAADKIGKGNTQFTLDTTGIIPIDSGYKDLGSTSKRFDTVFAKTLIGTPAGTYNVRVDTGGGNYVRFQDSIMFEAGSGINFDTNSGQPIVTVSSTGGSGTADSIRFVTDDGPYNTWSTGQWFQMRARNGIAFDAGDSSNVDTASLSAVPGEIDHDQLQNFSADEHFTQANITTTGTVTSGTWQSSISSSATLSGDWDVAENRITAESQAAESLFIGADGDTVKMYITAKPGSQTGQLVFRDSVSGEKTLAQLAAAALADSATGAVRASQLLGGGAVVKMPTTMTPTDNYVLKVDTDPATDTFYWAQDNTGGAGSDNDTSEVLGDKGEQYSKYVAEWSTATLQLSNDSGTTMLTIAPASGDSLTVAADKVGTGNTVMSVYDGTNDSVTVPTGRVRAQSVQADSFVFAGPTTVYTINGTGLTVTGNTLQATLGTDIVLSEMAANSVDSTKVVNGSLSSSDMVSMTSDSLARILSDEFGVGPFMRSTGRALSTYYRCSTSTVDGDPGPGVFRYSNASQPASNQIYVDDQTLGSMGMGDFWDNLIDQGMYLFLTHYRDRTKYHVWPIASAVTDASGYSKINLGTLALGGSDFSNNDTVIFEIWQDPRTLISDSLDEYLPLAGGTLSGDLTATGVDIQGPVDSIGVDTLSVNSLINAAGLKIRGPVDSLGVDTITINTLVNASAIKIRGPVDSLGVDTLTVNTLINASALKIRGPVDSLGVDTVVVNSRLRPPTGASTTPTLEGELLYDTGDDWLVTDDGTDDVVIGGKQKYFSVSIDDPKDIAVDTIMVLAVDGPWATNGIVITKLGVSSYLSATDEVRFAIYSAPATFTSWVDTVALSAAYENTSTTFSNATIAAGSYLVITLDGVDDDNNTLTVWGTFYVVDN